MHFKTLLLIVHYYAIRSACRQAQSTKSVCVKISVALLRYTDIVPADKAYYEAGTDLRDEGRVTEAFVLLNHYLDICEAIEDGEVQLVDHSDLGQTDFPTNIPIPEQLYLKDSPELHDSVREWILAVSMDQKVDQVWIGQIKRVFFLFFILALHVSRRCRWMNDSCMKPVYDQEIQHAL